MDKQQGARTRQEFVDRFANTDTLIIGSHFSDPTAGLDRARWPRLEAEDRMIS